MKNNANQTTVTIFYRPLKQWIEVTLEQKRDWERFVGATRKAKQRAGACCIPYKKSYKCDGICDTCEFRCIPKDAPQHLSIDTEMENAYGGLENLGDRLMKSENFEMALDEIIWLITLLANQSVLIHNLQHPEDKKEPLTQDAVELLTSPFELAGYKEAIMEAMYKGTKRNIESETDSKNVEVG